jgi:hypothetical protein
LIPGVAVVLKKLADALVVFGSGDKVSAPRVLKIVESAGSAIGMTSGVHDELIVAARSECVDSIFKLLGSDSFRNDEEIALSTGEALGIFASEYVPDEAVENVEQITEEWPADFDETYAKAAPPQVEVSR